MKKEKYKEKLLDEKNLLEQELGNLGRVDKTGDWEAVPESEMNIQEVQDEADLAERAEDYEEKSIKLNSLEKRWKDVNKALEKINTENYGFCEKCQEEIEKERMDANPAAPTCKKCMS